MKEEYWRLVKAGDYFILANIFDGVKRVRVTEVDVRVLYETPTTYYATPYGLTKDTGRVKVRVNDTEQIEELRNLITYSSIDLHLLQRLYENYAAAKAAMEAAEEVFTAKIQELQQL